MKLKRIGNEELYNLYESSPLEQFVINPIIPFILNKNIDLTISNSILYMILAIVILLSLFIYSKNNKIIINKYYFYFIKITLFLEKQILDIISLNNNKYFPFIFILSFFILINNLIGLIPYSFTPTSQIIITFLMSSAIIIGITIIGIMIHKHKFIGIFIPKGLPLGIIPIITLIEIISYLSRIISLSIRLTANIVAGHTILNIISSFGFTYNLLGKLFIIPVLFIILILELGVSIIQAIVFGILISTYLKDVLNLH
jgi:ATP synthase subunit 6